jgi:hypothetical protein
MQLQSDLNERNGMLEEATTRVNELSEIEAVIVLHFFVFIDIDFNVEFFSFMPEVQFTRRRKYSYKA